MSVPTRSPSQAPAQAAQPQGKSLSLSLEDCIVRALKANLDIKVAEFGPEQSVVSRAQGNIPFRAVHPKLKTTDCNEFVHRRCLHVERVVLRTHVDILLSTHTADCTSGHRCRYGYESPA